MNLVEKLLNRILPCKVIMNCDHDPYLHRWYLVRTENFGIFIHKFIRSDEDRALHDHPWNFLVIPIWRGYIEHSEKQRHLWNDPEQPSHAVPVARRVCPIISSRFRPAEFCHRVELIQNKPSWSIFFRFKNRRTWGFWPQEGWIAWNKWWQDKCE